MGKEKNMDVIDATQVEVADENRVSENMGRAVAESSDAEVIQHVVNPDGPIATDNVAEILELTERPKAKYLIGIGVMIGLGILLGGINALVSYSYEGINSFQWVISGSVIGFGIMRTAKRKNIFTILMSVVGCVICGLVYLFCMTRTDYVWSDGSAIMDKMWEIVGTLAVFGLLCTLFMKKENMEQESTESDDD